MWCAKSDQGLDVALDRALANESPSAARRCDREDASHQCIVAPGAAAATRKASRMSDEDKLIEQIAQTYRDVVGPGPLAQRLPELLQELQPGEQIILVMEQELCEDRKSTRLNSSHQIISYAVFC